MKRFNGAETAQEVTEELREPDPELEQVVESLEGSGIGVERIFAAVQERLPPEIYPPDDPDYRPVAAAR